MGSGVSVTMASGVSVTIASGVSVTMASGSAVGAWVGSFPTSVVQAARGVSARIDAKISARILFISVFPP